MKTLSILAAAVICVSGCRPADQDHVSHSTVRPRGEHTHPSARAEFFANSTSITAYSRNHAGVPQADLAEVRKMLDEDAADPRTLTPDELRLWAVRRLGLTPLSLDQIRPDGLLTESEAASLLLDRTATITSNVIERLAGLSPSAVERIAEEVRNLTAIAAGDYPLFTDGRLVMLYEYLAREDKPSDVRIEALCNLSDYAANPEQQKKLLLNAASLSRAFGGMRQHAPFSMLRIMYMERGQYSDALAVCKERLAYLDAGGQIPYAASVRGDLLSDTILCLSALGRHAQADELLNNARSRQDISEQYQRIFNSEEFLQEVRAYGKLAGDTTNN